MPLDDLINKYVPMTETAFLILSSLQEPKHGYLIMAYTKKQLIIASFWLTRLYTAPYPAWNETSSLQFKKTINVRSIT